MTNLVKAKYHGIAAVFTEDAWFNASNLWMEASAGGKKLSLLPTQTSSLLRLIGGLV